MVHDSFRSDEEKRGISTYFIYNSRSATTNYIFRLYICEEKMANNTNGQSSSGFYPNQFAFDGNFSDIRRPHLNLMNHNLNSSVYKYQM